MTRLSICIPLEAGIPDPSLLVAALPNPILRNPRRPTRALRALAGRIQGRTSGIGGLSQCVRP